MSEARPKSSFRGRRASLCLALLLCLCKAGAALEPASGSVEPPRRIVSVNLCADELVLRLAGPGRVASVSFLSQDPAFSPLSELAATLPANEGLAEEIVLQRPDLVVAGEYTTQGALDYLRRDGYPVVALSSPHSLAAARSQVLALAERLGVPERGRELAEAMPPPLAEGGENEGGPRALVLSPNAFTAGPSSIVDELIRSAGLVNLGAELREGGYGAVPLEIAILSGAEILIIDAEGDTGPSLATALLHHQALERLGRRIHVVSVPSRLWTCPGPQLTQALAILRDAAEAAR